MPVPQRDVASDWLAFVRSVGKPVFVLAYETRGRSGSDCDWVPDSFRQVGEWTCYDPLVSVGEQAFRDDAHPTGLGNQALAQRIATFVGPSTGNLASGELDTVR